MSTKSKIEAELLEATELSAKRGEDRQDLISRLMKAIGTLTDKAWDALSQAAQDWYNSAADAKNEKAKVLPDFPDLEEDEPAPTTTRRRGAKDEERLTQVGDTATVKTKRGKEVTGKVVELDKDVIVLDVDGKEEEFSMDRVESVTVNHGTAGGSSEPDDPFAKGTSVVLVTKRGKEVTGTILEIDDDIVVLDVDGKEEEFSRDRVESIKPAGGKAKDEPKASTRRGAATEDKGAVGAKEREPRSTNPPGVSIGQRIRELIVENMDAGEDAISKLLKKEGIDFRDGTLKLNYSEVHKLLDLLKARKLLK